MSNNSLFDNYDKENIYYSCILAVAMFVGMFFSNFDKFV